MNHEQQSRPGRGSSPAGSQASGTSTYGGHDLRAKADEALSKLTDVAQEAGKQATDAASSLASDANQQAKGLLNQQVASSGDLAHHIAQAAACAADDLDQNAPRLAGLVRNAAERIDDFSRDLRGKSVEDLVRTASDFTRRQPAVVFGLAALGGFSLSRVLKSDSASASRSPRTSGDRWPSRTGELHGT